MMWALGIASIILHHRLDTHVRLMTQEIAILGTAAVLFLAGALVGRGTSWGKRWLHLG